MRNYSENGTSAISALGIGSPFLSPIERILPLTGAREWESRTDLSFPFFLVLFFFFAIERHCIAIALCNAGNFVPDRFRDSFDQQRVE